MSFIDLGEVVLQPVIGTNEELVPQENVITEDQIWDGITNAVDFLVEKQFNYVNIIAHNEMMVQVAPDIIKQYNSIPMSISGMKDYKIFEISGSFNKYVPTVVIHSGINFDKSQMMLRIFSTVPYMKTTPLFITLFKNKDSDFSILDTEVTDYHGYGKINKLTNLNDSWNINYFTK